MESTNNTAQAASLAVDATNPLNQSTTRLVHKEISSNPLDLLIGQRELSDEFNTKLNIDKADSSSSSEYYTTSDDSSDYSDAEEEEEEGALIVDPQPPRPSNNEGSRTLFACNLAFHVTKSDIKEFFQEAGEVVEVKFVTRPDGSIRGFGHIVFASPEEAQTALGFYGRTLLGREICLDMAAIRP